MTIPQAAHDLVINWVFLHPGQQCRGQRRRELEDAVFDITHSRNIRSQVESLLRVYRPVIAPQYTNRGVRQRFVGEDTSNHPDNAQIDNSINNPRWNPINNNRRHLRNVEDGRRRAEANPNMHRIILTRDQIEHEVNRILNLGRVELGGSSILQAVNNSEYSIYIGMTRQVLYEEAFKWITDRGGNGGGRTRPVLSYHDRHITESQLRNDLHFSAIDIYHSDLDINVLSIEEGLQNAIQRFPLGVRLHRFAAMGQQYRGALIYGQVFITFARIDVINLLPMDVFAQAWGVPRIIDTIQYRGSVEVVQVVQ